MIFNNILCRFYRPKVNPWITLSHPFNHVFSLKKPTLTRLKGRED